MKKTESQTSLSDDEDKGDGLTAPEGFHPISCVQCRQLHKKCDKKLPECSKCSARGLKCTYNTPRKRGKGSDAYPTKTERRKKSTSSNNTEKSNGATSIDNQHPILNNMPLNLPTTTITTSSIQSGIPYTSPSSSIQNGIQQISLSGTVSPMNVVELYYTFLCSGHPVLKRAKFEFFVKTCLQQFLNGSPTLVIPPNEFITTEADMKCLFAFYLSALALAEQITAQLNFAQVTARRCELEIAKLSIDYFSNLYFVGACHNMGAYFIGFGDLPRSRYYLLFGDFYFSENQNRVLDLYEKNLEKHRAFVVGGAEQHSPNEFAIFIKGLPKILEISLDKKIEEILLPGTWDYLKNANVTSENFLLFKQVIEAVFNAVSSYRQRLIKMMVDCHSETFFKHQHMHSFIIVEGFKLLFLSRIPDISPSAVEEIALKITLMTEHELFPYCLSTTLASITTTCQYHLDICKMIERGLRPRVSSISTSSKKVITVDYFAFLEKDYRALTTLAKRYVRLSVGYKSLIDEMDQIIQRNLMPQNNFSLSSIPTLPQTLPQKDLVITDRTSNTSANSSPVSQNDVFLSALLSYLEGVTKNMTTQLPPTYDQFPPPNNFDAGAYENYQAAAVTTPSSFSDLF